MPFGINVPGVNITKSFGTGIPFIDFDANNMPQASTKSGLTGNVDQGMLDALGRVKSVSQAGVMASGGVNGGSFGNEVGSAGAASGGAYTGGSAAPKIDLNMLAQFDQAIGMINSNLGRIDSQRGIAEANINDQFNTGRNELDTARNSAQSNYNTSGVQNQQNYRTDKNVINDQASQGLRGLMRALGAMGAGGSTDAQFVAPEAVTQQATLQRSGAGQNFAQNQQSLDTNWGNFQNEEQNERKKLEDWRTQQVNSAQSQAATNRQDLLLKLADITGQRAQAAGGNYQGSAAPYIQQAQSLNGTIDNLARFAPTYQGNTPTYQAPELDSYNAGQNGAQMNTNALQGSTSPAFLSLLAQGQDKKRKF